MANSKTIVEQSVPVFEVKGSDLVITLPHVKDATGKASASGKSKVLASTHGNVFISELNCFVGLNVYRRVAK